MLRCVCVLLLAVSLSGCGMFACTLEALSSARVTVENQAGEPVPGAMVQFHTAEFGTRPCTEFGEPGEYHCGSENEGELLITVEADGFDPTEVAVDVDADHCHVITEHLTVTLTAAGTT